MAEVRPNLRWKWPNRFGSAEPRFWLIGRSLVMGLFIFMNLATLKIAETAACLINQLNIALTAVVRYQVRSKMIHTYSLTYEIPISLVIHLLLIPTNFALLFQDCPAPSLILDGICDDLTNNEACSFDGGDCCRTPPNFDYCTTCECKTMK